MFVRPLIRHHGLSSRIQSHDYTKCSEPLKTEFSVARYVWWGVLRRHAWGAKMARCVTTTALNKRLGRHGDKMSTAGRQLIKSSSVKGIREMGARGCYWTSNLWGLQRPRPSVKLPPWSLGLLWPPLDFHQASCWDSKTNIPSFASAPTPSGQAVWKMLKWSLSWSLLERTHRRELLKKKKLYSQMRSREFNLEHLCVFVRAALCQRRNSRAAAALPVSRPARFDHRFLIFGWDVSCQWANWIFFASWREILTNSWLWILFRMRWTLCSCHACSGLLKYSVFAHEQSWGKALESNNNRKTNKQNDCYLKLERSDSGRQEKVHIRIFSLSSSVNNWFGRHDSTQEHDAKLCTGVVGLKSVTGGPNLEVGWRWRAESCDHTRQTLTEGNT